MSGDATTVTLTVLAEHKDFVESIVKDEDYSEFIDDGPEVSWIFNEVNYGELKLLPQLSHAGVAYISAWNQGSEYGAGTSYCWFDEDGVKWYKDLYTSEANPNIDHLMGLIDKPTQLRQYILDHKEKMTPPTFDNQVEYGKRFLTIKLIAPNG